MRDLLSRRELTDSLNSLEYDYPVHIDTAISAVFQARTIIRKYMASTVIKDRLLVNNIIICNNILGPEVTNYAIYHSMDDVEYQHAKSVLLFLDIYDIRFGTDIDEDSSLYELFVDTLARYNSKS